MEGVNAIRQHARIIIASSRAPEAEVTTREWLRRNFSIKGGFVNTITSGKAAVEADVLIDDRLENVKMFAEQNQQKLALLLAQPWNKKMRPIQKLMDDGRIIVAKDWEEIPTLLK